MNRRNLFWLGTIVVVGVVAAIVFGVVWGIVGAVATLVVSEVVERVRRRRRGRDTDAGGPSVRDAITTRRRRR